MLDASIVERARDWIRSDPNAQTAEYVRFLIHRSTGQGNDDQANPPRASPTDENMVAPVEDSSGRELSKLFPLDGRRIGFGTAGLRAAMVPGPMGMNDLTVVQAAQGLARYCLANKDEASAESPSSPQRVTAVVGYDHRANAALHLSSLQFALLTTLVFLEAGLECILLDGYVATPLVPFSMQQTDAKVGVMITASHNPKQDAGYKVYVRHPQDTGGYACQIRSPADREISACILDNLEPWVEYGTRLQQQRDGHADPCAGLSQPDRTKQLVQSYFQAIQSSGLVTGQARLCKTPPKFCYTAMHGVGHAFATRMFEAFGLPPFVSVPDQQHPDGSFPTVPFPNPEEACALDLAKGYALAHGCHVVLANDPDADRLAVAEYQDSQWTVFTGDQIGTMLGHWLWQQWGAKPSGDGAMPAATIAMLASTVSSRMLAEIARVEGFHFEDTLTGFKWIGSRAAQLRATGTFRTLFCYEEAIGFCCGDVIFDKDGLSAMGVMGELALHVYGHGSTLSHHLQSLYDTYGEFVSHNGYYLFDDLSLVPRLLVDATAAAGHDGSATGGTDAALRCVGPYQVSRIRYLGEPGYDSSTHDRRPTLPTSSSSPMLTLWFENGCVAQFRGSGTEPKFKYYIEMKGLPGVSRSDVERDLQNMSSTILEELLRPERNGLRKP